MEVQVTYSSASPNSAVTYTIKSDEANLWLFYSIPFHKSGFFFFSAMKTRSLNICAAASPLPLDNHSILTDYMKSTCMELKHFPVQALLILYNHSYRATVSLLTCDKLTRSLHVIQGANPIVSDNMKLSLWAGSSVYATSHTRKTLHLGLLTWTSDL